MSASDEVSVKRNLLKQLPVKHSQLENVPAIGANYKLVSPLETKNTEYTDQEATEETGEAGDV